VPAVIKAADLPTLRSTRDGRDRIDLVTEELFGWTDLKADFIRYQPGDTAAAHYHVGARHIWFITEGEAVFHLGDEVYDVEVGDVVTAGDGEVHWFHNNGEEPFAFYELWVPAPTETVWVVADDI
jgi:mannose-6-phosphate isomerase-like protein (cupin superfamily)